jgi:hypothetical protein
MTKRTYAVWWQEGDGPRHAGKAGIGPLHMLLSGNSRGRLALALDDIATVEYGRGELEIVRRRGLPLRVGNLDGPGALLELWDALLRAA